MATQATTTTVTVTGTINVTGDTQQQSRRVQFAEGTVDNENMNKKKSKSTLSIT
jgi:hypothetical protein